MKEVTNIDDFGTKDTYKLYRSVYEIIHPAISKRNISNYKIIIDDNLTPLRIFYPKKISKIEKVIIYIRSNLRLVQGKKNYSEVIEDIVKRFDTLVIALDYELEEKNYTKCVNTCYETIKYLIEGLNRVGIENNKITLISDSFGSSILTSINMITNIKLPKEILLYPVLNLKEEDKNNYPSLEQNNKLDLLTTIHLKQLSTKFLDNKYKSPLKADNYNLWPKTLVITADLDPLRDEGITLATNLRKENKSPKGINITFASHGFLNSKDEESIEEAYKEMKKFIAKKEE